MAKARADFARTIREKGGLAFDTKEAVLAYLESRGCLASSVVSTAIPDDADAYAVLPAREAAAFGLGHYVRQPGGGDMVIVAGKWCPICMAIVVFIVQAILGGLVDRGFWWLVKWLYKEVCEICASVLYQEQTGVETECPDCLSAGDPHVVNSNDSYVTFYCPRSYTVWTEYNVYR